MISQKANSEPEAMDILDEIVRTASSKDVPLKTRLLRVGELAVKVRDLGRLVH